MNLAIRILLYVAVGYGALVALVYLRQVRMLCFPDTRKPPDTALRDSGLQFWLRSADSSYLGVSGE